MSDYKVYKCAFCGKKFGTMYGGDWVYRVRWKKEYMTCCSWSCMRKLNTAIWGNPNGYVTDYDAICEGEAMRKQQNAKRRYDKYHKVQKRGIGTDETG